MRRHTPIQISLNPAQQLADKEFAIDYFRLGLGSLNTKTNGLDIGLFVSNALQLSLIAKNTNTIYENETASKYFYCF